MNRDFLESLGLEKDSVNAIMAEHGKTVNAVKSDLVTAEQEADALKEQLANRDADIEKLKADGGSSDELKAQLDELTSKYETDTEQLNAKLSETKLNHAVEMGLKDSGAKNVKAAKALLDFETIKLTDSGVDGLKEQLEQIKTDNDYLFGATADPTKTPKVVIPGDPNGGGHDNKVTAEQFDAMTHTQKMELHATQPEVFKSITGQ